MPSLSRSAARRGVNVWPGWVDALSTLVMVIIFVLMVFVIAQTYLSAALSGREQALQRLTQQVAELADLLALERKANTELRANIGEISAELQASIKSRDELDQRLTVIIGERDALAASLAESNARAQELSEDLLRRAKELEEAYKVIEADRAKVQALVSDIAILESLRDELTRKLAAAEEVSLEEKEISNEAQLQVALLNRQILALREQLSQLADALELAETKSKEQEVQIADLGRRLNLALASKVEELARYRSEFFGRLREVLGARPDIRVVGDRFVFQSEVLFASGSAVLEPDGQSQLADLADTLLDIAKTIPPEIDWVLRVDGHTDRNPIQTFEFPSNWELSAKRAINVVRFLEARGVPPDRLAAAGFAEFRPLEPGDSPEIYSRNRRIELKLDQR
ncbi:MAG TPA: peptidoglycan -binding protein [Alphaproteobacteria bacterium]|nr:peptidoglycan -binding protein [Alphaproteobacteria bacterium]